MHRNRRLSLLLPLAALPGPGSAAPAAPAAQAAHAAAAAAAPAATAAADAPLQAAMRHAEALRDEAVRVGDQPYGAVVLQGAQVVGAARSRVVTDTDPTAHAEMEALRDAARRLRSRDLAGCVLVSTSRPCRMCEAAAAWSGIARMVHGPQLTDAGAPR